MAILTNKALKTSLKSAIGDGISTAGLNGILITTDYSLTKTKATTVYIGNVINNNVEQLTPSIFRKTQEVTIIIKQKNRLNEENLISIITNSAVTITESNNEYVFSSDAADDTVLDGTTGTVEKAITLTYEYVQ